MELDGRKFVMASERGRYDDDMENWLIGIPALQVDHDMELYKGYDSPNKYEKNWTLVSEAEFDRYMAKGPARMGL